METIRQYWIMMKKTGGDKLMLSFLIFYFADCLIIMLLDPAIENYGDALWMGFSVATTIGLGDYTVTSGAARFFTILLGVYGSIIEAYIPGLIASYYLKKLESRRNSILAGHSRELARVETMSQDEKKALTRTIRREGTHI